MAVEYFRDPFLEIIVLLGAFPTNGRQLLAVTLVTIAMGDILTFELGKSRVNPLIICPDLLAFAALA